MNNDGFNVMMGVCRFCGQTYQMEAEDQAAADAAATMACRCDEAAANRRVREIIRDARLRAADLFGELGEQDGFTAVQSPEVLRLLDAAIERVAYGELREVSMQIVGHGAAKIKASGAGGVKIERTRTLRKSEETV